MALPYARSQLVRYLTDKVMENVTKQIADQSSKQTVTAPESGSVAPANPDVAKLVDSINSAFAQTYEQIEALEARIDLVDRRMSSIERRWGLRSMAYVVLAVVIAFVLGLVAYQLLHAGGVF